MEKVIAQAEKEEMGIEDDAEDEDEEKAMALLYGDASDEDLEGEYEEGEGSDESDNEGDERGDEDDDSDETPAFGDNPGTLSFLWRIN